MRPQLPKLVELLDELEDAALDEDFYSKPGSKMEIHTETGVVEFTRAECERLLSSTSAVERLHEALGSPFEAELQLYEIEPSAVVHDKLEELFNVVD